MCGDASDCQTCNQIWGCQFCRADERCHPIGSINGCLVGMACSMDSLASSCMRETPESIQLSGPPVRAYIIGFSIAGGFLLALGLCVACSCKCCEPKDIEETDELSISSTENYYRTAESPTDTEDIQSPRTSDSPKTPQVNIRRRADCKKKCKRFWTPAKVIGAGLLFLVIFLTTFFLVYPREPEYSVCSTDIDWSPILQGLISGGLSANVSLQMSLKNPNIFGFSLDEFEATFIYQGEVVGTGNLSNLEIAHTAITDFIMNTTFSPSVGTAISMLADYEADTLLLDVDMNIETDVNIWGTKMFTVDGSYEASDVDPVLPDPRQYCLCK